METNSGIDDPAATGTKSGKSRLSEQSGCLGIMIRIPLFQVEYLKMDRKRFHCIGKIALIQQEFLAAVKEFAKHLQSKRVSPMTAIKIKAHAIMEDSRSETDGESRRQSQSSSFTSRK
ncbi:hypothetical protein HK102_005623 [Quaeritorhiza haematococci]|nr:hypothetical protein HK102_005623 [Quaeritorhiza haematococci]